MKLRVKVRPRMKPREMAYLRVRPREAAWRTGTTSGR
jgi:hypothetical protein